MADTNQIIKSRRGFRGVATRHVNKLKQILDDEENVLPRKIYDLKERVTELINCRAKIEDLDQQIFSTITDEEALNEEMDNAEHNKT